MAEYFISVNKIAIKHSRQDKYVNMSTFDDEDIVDKISKILNVYKSDVEKYKSSTANKEFEIKDEIKLENIIEQKVIKKDGRKDYKYLFFKVKAGENGIAQDVFEENKDEPVFEIKPEHMSMSTYYIFICFPYGNYANGIIIFQGIGKYGVKSAATRYLKKCIKKLDEELVLQINTISSLDHVKDIIRKNEITKFKMVKYYKPVNKEDRLCRKEERIFHYPKFKNFNETVLNMAKSGKFQGSGIAQIQNFDPDKCFTTICYNGKPKTIGLNNISNVGVVEYVDSMIHLDDKNNIPTPNSMLSIFKNAFKDYRDFLD